MDAGYSNVVEGQAIEISITGMAIVFTALVFISLFLTYLPKVLAVLEPYLPEASHGHDSPPPRTPRSDEELVAAIGFALHRCKQ